MALPPDKPTAFSRGAARKIKRAVQRINATPRGAPPAPSRAAPWTYGIVRAKVTTAIPSGTFESPSSSGRIQIHHKNSAGAWVASGDPVQIFNDNPLPSPIPVGRTVKPGWIGGEWWLVSGACS